MGNKTIIDILISLPGILAGLTFHEFAHGLIAYLLGDPTPKEEKRLTLNPIPHIDPIGLILILGLNFGWAKPVNINPSNFKDKKKSVIAVSLAGPVANLILAIVFTAILKFMVIYQVDPINLKTVYSIVQYGIIINIILAFFNLLPIPPLDGSKIFLNLISPKTYFKIIQYQYVLTIILIILLVTGAVGTLLNPIVSFVFNLLTRLFGLI